MKSKNNKENKKEIKTKNYVILTIIIISTIVISFYLLSWYRQYNNTKNSTPVIAEILPSVKFNELDTILKERDFLILYTCTTKDMECRNFEEKFKSYIIDSDLDNIVYLNLETDEDKNGTLNRIYRKYKHQDLIKRVGTYPTIFIFNNGKIIDLLSSNETSIDIEKVKQFLEGYDF